MNRRAMILALAAFATATRARAQTPSTSLPRIVSVSNRDPEGARPFIERFVKGMQQLGYVEGRNYVLDRRYAMNDQSRIAPAIREAVASRPDILLITGLFAARQARDATTTIPIVVATGSDLVDAGIVRSYARPGGNVTGIADLTDETSVKRLELLKAALPKAARIALITNPDFPATPKIEKMLREVAPRLGITLIPLQATDRASLISAIDSMARTRPDALLVGGDNNTVFHANEVIARATSLRIPVAYFWPGTAEMGALFSYQADVMSNFELAASYVDRILKGAKPGDLPIDLPKQYELVVNRKAAADLGIAIPATFLLRADRIID
jgi:putative tryptophan/tyrosine transport system substrate-binding protein